ncbi:RCC1-like G exchanging factor-like protein [Anabrus simplex]|uniref:RCC1-like G exchanging factor-like protein n=1 Tax=Anabrus simplex TaxID=316456 RepID=UPI0035A39040
MKTVSRSFSTTVSHFVKRKYPVNPEDAKQLPTFQYPISSSSDRRVYSWGLAEHGALGNREKSRNRFVQRPSRLQFAEKHKVVDVACGYGFTAFAVNNKEKYKVFGCGINTDSQIGYHAPHRDHPLGLVLAPAPVELPLSHPESTKVKQLAAGRAHLVVLTDQEGVFTLGNNAYGQCGRRIVVDEQYSGSQIIHHIPHLGGNKVKTVQCGQDHSMFITEKGEVFACGWGADGQTGLGHFKTEWQPSRVIGDVQGVNIVKVASTADCNLALSDEGDVFGWGNTEYGQLGCDEDVQQQNTARFVESCRPLGKIVDVAAGGSFCLVVNDAGDVFVWGYGILGKGPNVDQSNKPTHIPSTLFGRNEFEPDTKVVSVSAGLSHLSAVTNHGTLYTWGRNRDGCLGLGHTKDQFFPLKVAVGARVLKVSCGVDHTVALCQPFV